LSQNEEQACRKIGSVLQVGKTEFCALIKTTIHPDNPKPA
jgi:hypothetical protein